MVEYKLHKALKVYTSYAVSVPRKVLSGRGYVNGGHVPPFQIYCTLAASSHDEGSRDGDGEGGGLGVGTLDRERCMHAQLRMTVPNSFEMSVLKFLFLLLLLFLPRYTASSMTTYLQNQYTLCGTTQIQAPDNLDELQPSIRLLIFLTHLSPPPPPPPPPPPAPPSHSLHFLSSQCF